jgi:heptosyltransferase-3
VTLVAGYKADGRIDKLLAAHELADSTYIHIHPASRWKFKCWPVEKMAELIGRLQEDGWAIVLTSAPDPAELAMIEAIQRRLARPVTSFAGQLSFKEMAALIQRARLFIGVDSAPMHMAAAVQTPTVAIFGPSGEDNWRPWQVLHRVVASTDHACRPCGADGCAGSKISDCLQQLDVDAVHAAALQLLALPRDEAPS